MGKNALYSHKDKLLERHLKNVAESSKEIILSKNLNLDIISKENLSNIAYLIGISHDFGKATKFFQDYLIKGDKGILREEKAHSLISCIFCYLIIEKYCEKNNLSFIFPFITSFLVQKHHGNLSDIIELKNLDEKYSRKLKEQIESIIRNKEGLRFYSKSLDSFRISFSEILEELKNINDFQYFFFDKWKNLYSVSKRDIDLKEGHFELFLITELLFSVLVDCDKKDAANFEISNTIKQIPENIVQEYLEKKKIEEPEKFSPNLEINQIKNQIFNSCVHNDNLKKENKIYSITAPTGAGKTLTSLATALKLRYLLVNKENYKIHYVLPFTTIIDQNYEVFRDVLSKEFNEKNENDYIMKHHYLTTENLKKQDEENKDYKLKSYMDELLFIKSWDSALVVSSYVQLLETIIGGRNSFMNKFHNLVNSIIILDEVQCISSRYWDIFRNLFKELAEKFNVYFIFLTATQPLIFNRPPNKNECIELANPEELSKKEILNRVKVKIDFDEKDIDGFFNQFCESKNFKDRYLFILNTKKSSLELYKKFNENGFFNDYSVVYLSTNLTSFDRKKKLEKILGKKKKDSEEWEIEPLKKYIVVTTQLVEAGVDISSDICYRDFAPMDSIIQSAGRVNRFGELKNKKGKFVLIKLRDDRKIYSKYVYGKNDEPILDWTENSISEEIDNFRSSKDFIYIIGKFYQKAIRPDGQTKLYSGQLRDNIQSLNFNHEYKFIENKPTHSIFILNKDSNRIIEDYKKIFNSKPKTDDRWSDEMNKWRGELKRVRKEFQKFIIEVYPNDFFKKKSYLKNDFKEFGKEFYYLDLNDFDNVEESDRPYNPETGFNLDYEQDNII